MPKQLYGQRSIIHFGAHCLCLVQIGLTENAILLRFFAIHYCWALNFAHQLALARLPPFPSANPESFSPICSLLPKKLLLPVLAPPAAQLICVPMPTSLCPAANLLGPPLVAGPSGKADSRVGLGRAAPARPAGHL